MDYGRTCFSFAEMLVWLECRVTDVGIRTHLDLQFGTLIITPKTFHLTITMAVSFVDSYIPCTHS